MVVVSVWYMIFFCCLLDFGVVCGWHRQNGDIVKSCIDLAHQPQLKADHTPHSL